jgi:sulfatase maturation enzyme AslB (radical SAM superfamily)
MSEASSTNVLPLSVPGDDDASSHGPMDRLARPLRDLRLSVIDRCNLRCTYCMPEDSLEGRGVFLPREYLLTDDELLRLVRTFVSLGVSKVRLTGGEPLLRPGLTDVVRRIAAVPGVVDLALTTNGILLPRLAAPLREAGLGRITVSLDSLDETKFAALSGGHGSVSEVLNGIEAAEAAGFHTIKINTVIQRGVNDSDVEALVAKFRAKRRTAGPHPCVVAPAAAGQHGARRNSPALPLRGRAGRDWFHLVNHPAFLRRLHAGTRDGRWQFLHLSVLLRWTGTATLAAPGR